MRHFNLHDYILTDYVEHCVEAGSLS